MKISRQFLAPWPAVLVEMKDFVELARLSTGGSYRRMLVSVMIATTQAPLQSLASSPVAQFRQWLEHIPRCQKPARGFFDVHSEAFHFITIEIEE
jgi:hypothetical protein